MPPRALDALRASACVYAEDTRVTGKLLALFDIHTHLERCDEATIAAKAPEIIERVRAGEVLAYCSDAGMPGVSDPGMRLVAAAHAADAPVEVLAGPTAVTLAYVASGFACPRFYFGGFFPRKAGERAKTLESLATLDAVLVFYESPNRVADALEAMASVFPSRKAAVCRELTKLHEEILIDDTRALAQEFAHRQARDEIRGEFVLVLDAPTSEEHAQVHQDAAEAARARAAELLSEGKLSKKDVAKHLANEFGLKRNEAYEMVLEISAS